MNRRVVIAGLGSAAAWPLAARAQQAPVIGILAYGPVLSPTNLASLRKGLDAAGYVEGKNVTFDFRPAERYDQFSALAADLVRHRVAVILTLAIPNAALAAKAVTSTIPIVFTSGGPGPARPRAKLESTRRSYYGGELSGPRVGAEAA
jgi:ABC-type uncharacterized transport system substrate-binding protein